MMVLLAVCGCMPRGVCLDPIFVTSALHHGSGQSYQPMVDQALIEKLTALLKDHTEVCAAYLFGSRARGSHTSTSDVDIAVAFAPATSAWHEIELQEQLAGQLAMPVQVVDLARAGPHLVKAV